MPKLPDLNDLGARPVPQSRRRVASNPAAGAVGDALSGFGDTAFRIAQQKFDKEDRLSYAAAKTAILRADVEARSALQDDPDYTTYEKRYSESMKAAREQAGKLIVSKQDRALFDQDVGLDFERGLAQVKESANSKKIVARKAVLYEGLESLRDTGRDALDDGTRTQTIDTARELIGAAQKEGIIDPLAAAQLRENWAGDYATEQVTLALNREEPGVAGELLTKFGDVIPWERRAQLEARTRGVLDVREARERGEWAVSETSTTEATKPLPTSKWAVISEPGAPRDGGARVHKGYDIAPTAGAPGWHPMLDFRLENPRNGERQGLTVDVVLKDGTKLTLMHLAELPKPGSYRAGDLAAIAGNTGNAKNTPTHFHVEATAKNGGRIDPRKYFADGTGGAPGAQQQSRRHNLEQAYALLDERANAERWTPEERERAKGEVDQIVRRDELLEGREEQDAYRAALDTADSLGDNFTDVSQIPNFGSLDPDNRMALRNMAQANKNAKLAPPPANGDVAMTLNILAARDPGSFKEMDLRPFRSSMRPSEFEALAVDQARMQAKGEEPSPTASLRSEIDSAITFHNKMNGFELDLGSDDGRKQYGRMTELMRQYLDRVTESKRAPTDDELKQAYDHATMRVVVREPGWFGDSRSERPRFQAKVGDRIEVSVPGNVRARIVDSLQRNGVDSPTEAQIMETYLRGKGRPGLWP